MATLQPALLRIVAVYCALVPLLYLPFDGLIVSLVVVPLVPLAMLASMFFTPARRASEGV
jgi:hypothetical protein